MNIAWRNYCDPIDGIRKRLVFGSQSEDVTNGNIFQSAKESIPVTGDPNISRLSDRCRSRNAPDAAI
jgi:hypothetical protein